MHALADGVQIRRSGVYVRGRCRLQQLNERIHKAPAVWALAVTAVQDKLNPRFAAYMHADH
jgi:hypothetical protein